MPGTRSVKLPTSPAKRPVASAPVEPSAVAAVPADAPVEDRVRAALELVRPAVKADGGDVEFVDVQGELARVRFHGACVGCPSSMMTLRHGIERTIVDRVPEISRVEPVE